MLNASRTGLPIHCESIIWYGGSEGWGDTHLLLQFRPTQNIFGQVRREVRALGTARSVNRHGPPRMELLALAQLGVLVDLNWSQIKLSVYHPDCATSVIQVPGRTRKYYLSL